MAPTCRKINTFHHKKREKKEIQKLFMFYLMYELSTIHRDYWVHPINIERPHKGEFNTHYADLQLCKDRFFEYYPMTLLQFDYVLEKIAPLIRKQDTHFRESVCPEEKPVITIMQVLFAVMDSMNKNLEY